MFSLPRLGFTGSQEGESEKRVRVCLNGEFSLNRSRIPPMIPIFCALPIGSYTLPQAGNQVTINRPAFKNPDGSDGFTVASVQPTGALEWRKTGTAGPWELATPQGDLFLYAPDGGSFGYRFYSEAKA